MKIIFILIKKKNKGKQEIIWKSKKTYEDKILKKRVELKLFERKLEFWNSFRNWSLENYLKIGVSTVKFKNWNFGKLNLKEIGNLQIIWELEFWKLNLKEIGVSKIVWELKFWKLNYENWELGNYFKMEVLKIGILKLFENRSFKN